jgi:DNA replication protein DnaC
MWFVNDAQVSELIEEVAKHTAKRHLRLEKGLDSLDGFGVVILDDIGYVPQNREEMEVLRTTVIRLVASA